MSDTIEKERLSENLTFPWWIQKEHRARYFFVSQFTPNATVLDCACGTGEGSSLFSKEAKEVLAVDIAQDALLEAGSRFQKENLSFKIGSALNIPVADHFADLYVSLETIEHIENEHTYLQEAVRVLKNSGTFICSTPNRLVTNPGKSLSEKPANPFHVREYSPNDLLALLEKYFPHVELFGLNPNHRWKVNALHFFGKHFLGHLSTRLHQIFKLFFFTFKQASSYTIKPLSPQYEYEYLIAICRK